MQDKHQQNLYIKKICIEKKLKVEVSSRKLKDDVQVGDLMVVEYYTPQYNNYTVY